MYLESKPNKLLESPIRRKLLTTGPYSYGSREARSHSVDGLLWRGQWVHEMDCFDRGLSRFNFAQCYDIATLSVGGGSNDVTTLVSHNTLQTGAVIGNQEGTRIFSPLAQRSRLFFAEIMVELPSVANIEFRFGFYKDADEFVYIEFDKSVNDNWRLTINDTTGQEWSTEEVPVTVGEEQILRLWVEADGTTHWAIGPAYNTVREIGTTGIANKMTADDHYLEYLVKTEATTIKRADIDYLEIFKLKAH